MPINEKTCGRVFDSGNIQQFFILFRPMHRRRFESFRPDHLKQWVTVDAVAHFLFGLAMGLVFGMALVIVYQLLDL